MTYGNGHYGANYWYPFDWWWLWWWGCTCEPEIYCGVIGYRAVQCYIEYDDGDLAEGVICVGGTEVWSGEARHNVWSYYPYDGEGYCPCGCEKGCPHCSCKDADGPSQGSVRFRVGLGEIDVGRTAGFAWFESDGPVEVTSRLFAFSPSPGTELSVSTNGNVVTCETLLERGNDLRIEPVTNGVLVTVALRRTAETNVWEITNVGGDSNVVRFVKRDLADDVSADWTYVCRWEGGRSGRGGEGGGSDDGGEWVWEVTDNLAHGHASAEPLVWTEDGTNWVYDADGLLRRLTVGTNGEETVVRTFSYDGEGRVVRVDDGTNGCVTLAYDAAGNVSEMTGPEGTLRAAWDAEGSLTNLDASAWNGEVPDARPRRLLMGAPGGGITPASALSHFLDGTGTPMTMPFSAVDTGWLSPCEFGGVRSFVSSCHEPGSYPVSGTRAIATKGSQQYFLGHVTVAVEGTVTYAGHCNWTFSGTMRALDDEYNFNAANRGQAGETLTKIGRALFQAHGKPFAITFAGTKPLVGSGHCGD